LGVFSLLTTGAWAEEKTTLKFAHQLPPAHFLSKAVEGFAQRVMQGTGGGIEFQIYPAAQLYRDKEIVDATRTGGIEMGMVPLMRWASIEPDVQILDLPFLFSSSDTAEKALDGLVGKMIENRMARHRVRLLGLWPYGFMQISNNVRQIRSPGDIKGLKIRSWGGMASKVLKILGASPVTLSASEVYIALSKGTVDGAVSGLSSFRDRKYYEVQKFATVANILYAPGAIFINEKTWNKLTLEQRNVMVEASRWAKSFALKEMILDDDKALKDLRERGMEISVLSPAEIDQWKAVTRPVLDEWMQGQPNEMKELVAWTMELKK
ncbi:MAG: DctP family TRAP transporter solute-binding subunit, partial [Syntrophaceae bacterium]|nr:DctP family TRAP transporter solute-binding subunit [Syntrophaceae bacterium]